MMRLMIETLAAVCGTVAFSVLFQIRPKHYLFCGLTGGLGWLIYRLLSAASSSSILATFAAALGVSLCARWFATLRKTPALIFLVSGILPLVPGAAIYYSAYYLFWDQNAQSAYYAELTLKLGVAIALGVLFAYVVPERVFGWHYPKIEQEDISA